MILGGLSSPRTSMGGSDTFSNIKKLVYERRENLSA